eukprot:2050644-Alexandrium_andersonii.AAC.1
MFAAPRPCETRKNSSAEGAVRDAVQAVSHVPRSVAGICSLVSQGLSLQPNRLRQVQPIPSSRHSHH